LNFEWNIRARFLRVLPVILCRAAGSAAPMKPNHLIGEHSPYLERAADQAVDWCPWDKDLHSGAQESCIGRQRKTWYIDQAKASANQEKWAVET
jgi:hypothetical protein